MKNKPISLPLKVQRRESSTRFGRIERRAKKVGCKPSAVWDYLNSREIYTYHAGLATGKDKGKDAEFWLELMLSYVTANVLAALDTLEIDW